MGVCLALALGGCKKDDMAQQPKYKAYQASEFFADGASARPLVQGVVARDDRFASPLAISDSIPFPITPEVLDSGHERFDIFCSACHGRLGNGRGMIPQRGFTAPPSYHIDRLRQQPDSHFYGVITNGFNAMYSFNDRITPDDRWCIVAYIRALQQAGENPQLSAQDRQTLYGSGDTVHR
jgi:Cytochrome C oxidase, cbb3-type, subunit III